MNKLFYPTIDLLKFIFAIMVVALHTGLFLNSKTEYILYILTSMLLRLAVPFFFVASGYFLADKLFIADKSESNQIVKGCCLH